jgi:hypothetical protein
MLLTGKLQKEIGIKTASLTEVSDHDTLLGNWCVNIFTLDRRKTTIFVNERTHYSFIIYGIKKSNVGKLSEIFVAGLEQSLTFEGLPSSIIKRISLEYGMCQFTKTDSKKVLGNMNDLVGMYSHSVYYNGDLKNCDLSDITLRINRTPQRNIKWEYSINVLRTLLGLEKAKVPLLYE